MPALLLALLFGLADLPGTGLPYEAQPVSGTSFGFTTMVRGLLAADLDGDGREELVGGVTTGMVVRGWSGTSSRTLAQCNLPPRYVAEGARVTLDAAADVDGDGRDEILATARTADGWDQRLWILDPLEATWLLDVALPTGPDRRPDGRWDGLYQVAGVVPGPAGKLIIVEGQVNYDVRPRQIMAVAPGTGEVVWSCPLAGNPHDMNLADVDDDGRPEIVAGIGSGANLKPGEEVRGRLDDEAWLMVLAADGSPRWERRLGPRFSDPLPVTVDLDGDGRTEIVVTARSNSDGSRERVAVLDGATGELLDEIRPGTPGRGLAAWPEAPGRGRVVFATADARLIRCSYAEGRLRVEDTVHLDAGIAWYYTVDILPDDGPESLVFLVDGRALLLDADLQPLADLPEWERADIPPVVWRTEAGPRLAYLNGTNGVLAFVPVPTVRRYAVPLAGGGLLLGAGGTALTLLRQRRRLRGLRRTSRRDLLRAFLTARHGTVGPVGVLERVVWTAEAGDGAPGARLAAVWAEAQKEAVPDLEALLAKAEHVRLDPPLLAVVRRELGRLVRHCEDLVALSPDARGRAARVAAARTSLGLVTDGMRSLGATLAASCVLDPRPLLRELVDRHAARRPDVAFVVTDEGGDEEPSCHADRADLEFLLDNLLDNAARHAGAEAPPRVAVALAREGRRLVVTVADNGPGVPAAERERIFAAGVSTKREGGGLGLWHSRQAVRYYGGDLLIDDGPEGGARFTVLLRAADR